MLPFREAKANNINIFYVQSLMSTNITLPPTEETLHDSNHCLHSAGCAQVACRSALNNMTLNFSLVAVLLPVFATLILACTISTWAGGAVSCWRDLHTDVTFVHIFLLSSTTIQCNCADVPGVLPDKLGRRVRPTDQLHLLPYQTFDTLFKTWILNQYLFFKPALRSPSSDQY